MSLATAFRLVVTQIVLIHLIGVCLGDDYVDYDQFITPGPQPQVCGPNMICVPNAVCVAGELDTDIMIEPRNAAECPQGTVCCRNVNKGDEDEDENPPHPIANGCGFRNEKGVDRRSRGLPNEAEFGEFPWMLALLSNDRSEVLYGGASLIHAKIALTAAHVIHDKGHPKIKVRAGEWDTNQKNELFPHQERAVSEKIIHENFNNGNLHNDIALLFLDSPFELSPHINTVCLPPPNTALNYVSCFATGWGKIASNKENPAVLKRVSLKVVANSRCQSMMRRTYLGYFFRLHASFMCAGGIANEDTCYGDGGSPLACPIPSKDGRYYEVGIVSWGLQNMCGEQNIPGVYASVSFLRGWVDQKITGKGFDSSSYTAV